MKDTQMSLFSHSIDALPKDFLYYHSKIKHIVIYCPLLMHQMTNDSNVNNINSMKKYHFNIIFNIPAYRYWPHRHV